jgi:hypothetical protein
VQVLGIPSPKGDIDGSQVGHVFYVDKDIDRIVSYCEKTLLPWHKYFFDCDEKTLLIEDGNYSCLKVVSRLGLAFK